MNEYIKFSSVSAAQKARMVLMRHGVRSMVGKNPSPKKSEGCSFALFVDDAQSADVTLKTSGILSKGIGRL